MGEHKNCEIALNTVQLYRWQKILMFDIILKRLLPEKNTRSEEKKCSNIS